MEMTLRWYGSKFDTVTLQQIRQIPGVTGVITTLYDTQPGEPWEQARIHALKEEVEVSGLHISGIESVNKEDIHMVCYNFMPVFDWTRTELARVLPDGSTAMAYTQQAVDALDPEKMFESIAGDMNGTVMPGWEPERMARVKELFEMYRDVDGEKLFANLKYFLEAIMPVCDRYDINMAIHPDDPAWSVFGLPHMIRSLKGRIHFAHVRNLKFHSPTNFEEAPHPSVCGSFDMYEIVKALYDIGFDGPIRPDHGRMIWGEVAMPGYGLYDRALGACYIQGLWEASEKGAARK